MRAALLALASSFAIGAVPVGCGSPPAMQGNPTAPSDDVPQGCTRDARTCPDGSSVGRVPPACEFAPCPAGNDPPTRLDAPPPAPSPIPTGGASGSTSGTERSCAPPKQCTGPRMLAPNSLCPDGKSQSGPACVEVGETCEWRMLSCPR
jgi:hypothetical protein